MSSKYQGKVFYGWWIVAAGFLIMGAAYGIVTNCVGLFVKPVTENMGFTRQAFSMNQTLVSFAMMAIPLLSGKIFGRFNVKTVMRLCTVTLVLSYGAYSLCTSLPMFYGCSVVVGLSLGGVTSVPLSLLISNWFHERRGLAIGVAFMGSGVGGMVFNPIVSSLLQNMGWRATYQAMAVAVALLVAPMTFFVIRQDPEEMGLTPLGNGRVLSEGPVGDGMLFRDAKKTARFYLLCLCTMVASMAGSVLMQNNAPYLTDIGYSVAVAATFTAVCPGSLAAGKMLLGQLYDKVGTRRATFISNGATVLGLCTMLVASFSPALLPIVLCQGLGCAFGTVAHPIITQSIFGLKDYSTIYGIVTAMGSLGGAMAPVFAASIYDASGSYKGAYLAMAAMLAVITLIYGKICPKEKKEPQEIR